MKKLFIAFALTAFSAVGFAQQGNEQPNDDQLQQQAPRETQITTERAAKVDAVQQQSAKEVQAEAGSKEQGQTQKQTKAQPVGINPTDTDAKPKDLTKQRKIMSEDSKSRN